MTPAGKATTLYLRLRGTCPTASRDATAWTIVESYTDAPDWEVAEMARTLRDLVLTEMAADQGAHQ